MQMCDWGLIQQSIISSNCQPILNTALSLPLMVQSNSCTDELFRPQPWPHQQTGQTGRLSPSGYHQTGMTHETSPRCCEDGYRWHNTLSELKTVRYTRRTRSVRDIGRAAGRGGKMRASMVPYCHNHSSMLQPQGRLCGVHYHTSI